jgi:hypothetical protein
VCALLCAAAAELLATMMERQAVAQDEDARIEVNGPVDVYYYGWWVNQASDANANEPGTLYANF